MPVGIKNEKFTKNRLNNNCSEKVILLNGFKKRKLKPILTENKICQFNYI